MNRTYLIMNDLNKTTSLSSISKIEDKSLLNLNETVDKLEQKRTEMKLRLENMKKRTKVLLQKHDWQSYFPNQPEAATKPHHYHHGQLLLSKSIEILSNEEETSQIFTDASFISAVGLASSNQSLFNLLNQSEESTKVHTKSKTTSSKLQKKKKSKLFDYITSLVKFFFLRKKNMLFISLLLLTNSK